MLQKDEKSIKMGRHLPKRNPNSQWVGGDMVDIERVNIVFFSCFPVKHLKYYMCACPHAELRLCILQNICDI